MPSGQSQLSNRPQRPTFIGKMIKPIKKEWRAKAEASSLEERGLTSDTFMQLAGEGTRFK